MSVVSEERAKSLILDYFGSDVRICVLRRAALFGAPVFVVDFDRGPRHFRTLGSFGASGQVTEQSSMDLLYPARLVFHYERLMALALALCGAPESALLLGVGGAAMWRFLKAYLPDCATTLVEPDETILALARRWFYLKEPAVRATAEGFLAANSEDYDAILVDIYNASGPAHEGPLFWARSLDALRPGGCLANNWADFATNRAVRPLAQGLAEAAAERGLHSFYVTRRGLGDNLVQFVRKTPLADIDALFSSLEAFAKSRHLPDRGRGILEGCVMTSDFPVA
jgi:hypothetical protein